MFGVWQPNQHRGAAVVNEPGSVNFNGLHTRDLEGAKAFYGAVFGWEALPMGMWALPAYGDHLEALNPGTRARTKEMGGPTRFEEVVAAVTEITDDTPPHWDVTFGVADADAIAERAAELGGTVLVPPFDAPWIRGDRHPRPAGRDVQREPVRAREQGPRGAGRLAGYGVHKRPLRGLGQPLDHGVERQAAAGVEQVEALEAGDHPEDVVGLLDADARPQVALLVELAGDPAPSPRRAPPPSAGPTPPTASGSSCAIERSARHRSRSAASISDAARRPPRSASRASGRCDSSTRRA